MSHKIKSLVFLGVVLVLAMVVAFIIVGQTNGLQVEQSPALALSKQRVKSSSQSKITKSAPAITK